MDKEGSKFLYSQGNKIYYWSLNDKDPKSFFEISGDNLLLSSTSDDDIIKIAVFQSPDIYYLSLDLNNGNFKQLSKIDLDMKISLLDISSDGRSVLILNKSKDALYLLRYTDYSNSSGLMIMMEKYDIMPQNYYKLKFSEKDNKALIYSKKDIEIIDLPKLN